MNTTTRQAPAARIIYMPGQTDPRVMVAALDKLQLDDVITGRARINGDRSLDLAIWNAAIDRDNGYDR
jgi:hypothetical protein